MKTQYLLALAISSAALVACGGGDTQGPSGGGHPTTGSSGTASGGASGTGSSSGGNTSSGGTSGGTSSGGTSGGSSSGNPVQTDTWKDGKQITANLDIVAGATVTLDPGAKITVAKDVAITVHGTLTASDKANHASLSLAPGSASGSTWAGIIVAQGGTMNLVGVDLNGSVGITAQTGDAAAEYDYGTMTGGAFTVQKGATFKTDHAAVVKGGGSAVAGAFTATFMDYAGASLTMSDALATVNVADSKISGIGGDFFTTESGKLIHVEYTTVAGTHCPFHFDHITQFQLDHVSTGPNAYGLMIYNTEAGPHSISYSSFDDPEWDQNTREPKITVDHSYIKNIAPAQPAGQVTISNVANAPIAAATPRGKPGPN
jgi:hypothetical protein